MKHVHCVTFILFTILPSFLQDYQSPGLCRVETKYDSLADTTTVQFDDLVKWGEAPAGLTVQANASFRGKETGRWDEPNETAKFWLLLSSNKGGATRQSRPLFQDAKIVYLSMDSTQMEIPVCDYRYDFFELIRSYAESAKVELNHEDLQKLLTAKRLECKWGGFEFKFSDSALASLKKFISRQIFPAHNR